MTTVGDKTKQGYNCMVNKGQEVLGYGKDAREEKENGMIDNAKEKAVEIKDGIDK